MEVIMSTTTIHQIEIPNINNIKDFVLENFKTFYEWNTGEPNYYGFGLTYNPDYPLQKEKQVLGCIPQYYKMYHDTHSFDQFTCNESKELFDLINLPYKPVRSRIAVIDGSSNVNSYSAWHVDEHPKYCTRINIPIITNEHYHLQTETDLITPKYGYGYLWDTSKMHRAFVSEETSQRRINLVLGYIPDNSKSFIPREILEDLGAI